MRKHSGCLFSKVSLHHIILCRNHPQSDHPGGPWHHNLYRGGRACVSVCVHVCLCLGKRLLTCMNMLLHLPWIVLWHPTPLPFCFCLFVSNTFTLGIFMPGRPPQGRRSTLISCYADTHYMYWVGIHIQRTGQCKCKHKPTNQNKRAQYGSFSHSEPLHSLCLPSLLAGVAIRSYNDHISFLTQGPSEAFYLWLEKYIFGRV